MKFLFASPHALFDSSSGAAISMYSILKELKRAGHSVATLQSTIYDSQANHALRPHPEKPLLKPFSHHDNDIPHTIVPCKHWYRPYMTAIEELAFEGIFNQFIKQAKPDVLITYGGMLLERAILRNAKEQGIKTVFYLVNLSYSNPLSFRDVDLPITDSASTSNFYKNKYQLDVRVIGRVIDKETYKVKHHKPEYITFINPTPEKGASLVINLARKLHQYDKKIKFLIVESRGKVAQTQKILEDNDPLPDNVSILPTQADMRNVYEKTKILLLPSFIQESGPRVSLEAVINKIPVIASNHGGTKELIGDAGTYVDIPVPLQKNPLLDIPESTLHDWEEAVLRLLNHPEIFAEKIAACENQAKLIDNQKTIRNLIGFLN